MQSKKKQSKRVSRVVYRAINAAPPAENAERGAAAQEPGAAGQQAITAAATHQLNRYAEEIEQFLKASRMRTLVNRIQSEIAPPTIDEVPHMRIHRD